jgi:putative copper export protein/methionine-rich copper-binding protein CopC
LPQRLTILAVLSLLVLLVAAAPAAAHARLTGSQPADGVTLRESPEALTLTFSEPVELAFGTVQVLRGDGRRLKPAALTHPGGDARRVRVPLGQAPSGRYAVRYRIVSTDGHPIRGSFSFTVRIPAASKPAQPAEHKASTPAPTERAASAATAEKQTPAAQAPRSPVLLDAAQAATGPGDPAVERAFAGVRLALFIALVLLVGVPAFLVAIWPAGFGTPRVARMLWAAWALAATATAASVVLQTATVTGLGVLDALDRDALGDVLTTRYGMVAAGRGGLLLAATLLLVAVTRQPPSATSWRPRAPRWFVAMAAPLGLALLATLGLAGHAASGPLAPLGLTADVLHLAAVSVWLSGLVVLVAVVLPRRDPVELRQVLPRFSRLAFAAVLVIVTTGTVQSWRQLGAPAGLVSTPYGRLLAQKLVLVSLLLVVAAVSRAIVQRRLVATTALALRPAGPGAARLDPDLATVARLRRSVALEVGLAIVVLALTSVLVSTDPGHSAEPGDGRAVSSWSVGSGSVAG